MTYSLSILLISLIYLLILNYLLKKKKFLIDKVSIKEKHKKLLSLDSNVPLSGSFYFFPFIFFLFYQTSNLFLITCGLFFCLGLLSDLKITDSPKTRLLVQFLLLLFFIYFTKDIEIDIRIEILNKLTNHEFFRVFIISFFFLVLINGFNFIDGANNLCSLNFLIILIFIFFLSKDIDNSYIEKVSFFLILLMAVFVLFNFFGKNFLGDGGVYGFSFLIGLIIIQLSSFDDKISPYFLANLLWYPAFENLFSIIRRTITKRKNFIADNYHIHHLIFKYFYSKNFFKKKYLLSSFVGITINCYLTMFYIIGFFDYSDTKRQILLIFINIIIYLTLYFKLKKIDD